MPRKAVDYSNTIIYKIQHEDIQDLLYVGHTTDFTKRKCIHKHSCTNPNSKKYNCKVYQMIRANGGWECFNMIEIKKFPCNDSREAFAEENRIMTEMESSMNSIRPPTGLTKQEYDKQWRDNNPDYDKKYNANNPGRFKKWRAKNPDKIKEQKTKIICGCGSVVCKGNLVRHLDTGKHFRWLQNKNIQ